MTHSSTHAYSTSTAHRDIPLWLLVSSLYARGYGELRTCEIARCVVYRRTLSAEKSNLAGEIASVYFETLLGTADRPVLS